MLVLESIFGWFDRNKILPTAMQMPAISRNRSDHGAKGNEDDMGSVVYLLLWVLFGSTVRSKPFFFFFRRKDVSVLSVDGLGFDPGYPRKVGEAGSRNKSGAARLGQVVSSCSDTVIPRWGRSPRASSGAAPPRPRLSQRLKM